MASNGAPTDADAYADWINRRIGREVQRRREEMRISAYALGKVGLVTDQTILNPEQGNCERGCLTGTLARICVRLSTPMADLVTTTEEVQGRDWEDVPKFQKWCHA